MNSNEVAKVSDSVHDVIRSRLLAFTPTLLPLAENLAQASTHDVTVLLTGETGTGKTFLARLMHECSPRKDEPFLTVSCGAQPANLIESIFFGHVKGAFTGADQAKDGKLKAAGNGTILLDDVDTLNLKTQASLLRAIETGEYEPVGGNKTLQCNARIVAASNRDLTVAAMQSQFRQDLYYRLSIISFHLLPLRERIEDIRPLVCSMVARFAVRFKKSLYDISPEAIAALENFPWPGNIRQLENAVQQAVLLSSGNKLLLKHLPMNIREHSVPETRSRKTAGESLVNRLKITERSVIQQTLHDHNFNRSRAAMALGISRELAKKPKEAEADTSRSAAEILGKYRRRQKSL